MKNLVATEVRKLTLKAISDGASLRRLLRINPRAPGRRPALRCLMVASALLALVGCCTIGHHKTGYLHAGKRQGWQGATAGAPLALRVFEPVNARSNTPVPVIFYLLNLATRRAGWENDASIVRDFRAEGYLVVTVDFAKHTNARMPFINRDLGKLRDDVRAKKLLGDFKVDMAHVFIVPAGCRLKREVVFHRDAGRTLAMDIIYPSKPKRPVGTVLEFSCDNKDRFGNFSLSVCSDTLLDGFAVEGFAVAMADHPVAPPYKGLDPMPDCALKIKAAVRTLRIQGEKLGLNSRIVPVGFSRGSGMALMLVTTTGMEEFEGAGENAGVSSDVQGAVVMSGRFTYLDLLPDDKMLPRYAKAWGERETSLDVWRAHGALDYLPPLTPSLSPSDGERVAGSSAAAAAKGKGRVRGIPPLFLTINCTESPDALHQMEVLRNRLQALGARAEFHLDNEPRGHKVTLDPTLLSALRDYVAGRLNPGIRP
jgi:acetyl esterase/lipase